MRRDNPSHFPLPFKKTHFWYSQITITVCCNRLLKKELLKHVLTEFLNEKNMRINYNSKTKPNMRNSNSVIPKL